MELYDDSDQVDVACRGGCADSIANLTYFPDSGVEAMVYY